MQSLIFSRHICSELKYSSTILFYFILNLKKKSLEVFLHTMWANFFKIDVKCLLVVNNIFNSYLTFFLLLFLMEWVGTRESKSR